MNGKRLKTPTSAIIYQKGIRGNFTDMEFASWLFIIREVEKAAPNSSTVSLIPFDREWSREILSYIANCFVSGKFLNHPELRIRDLR
jgi:hypothetical protein